MRRRPTAPDAGPDDRLFEAFLAAEQLKDLSTPLAAVCFSLELLRDLIPSEVAFGSLYDIDEDVLRVVAMRPAARILPSRRTLSTHLGIIARALATLEPPLRLVSADHHQQLATVDGERITRVRSTMYMPVRSEGRLLGLVHMVNRVGPGFTWDDAGVVSYVGDRLAEAIHRTRCEL